MKLALTSLTMMVALAAASAHADKEADENRALAAAMGFSKSEIARAVDDHAWDLGRIVLPAGGGRVLSAVTTELADPQKGEGEIKTPRAKVILERGGKTIFSWSAAGAKAFGWHEQPLCDQGIMSRLFPIDVGGKQHVQLDVGCSAGEDCIHGETTVFLFRIEVDAAGAPSGLKLVWVGAGDNGYPVGDCIEGACRYTQNLAFALSGDGKTLMLKRTDTIVYDGEDSNAKAKHDCKVHGPHAVTESVAYALPDGGMKTFAGAAPEAPILDDATPPAKAAQLALDAAKRDAGERHDFAVAANSRGHRLFQAGKCADALPLFEAASTLDAKYGMPRYNAARCYALAGDAARSIHALVELKALGKSQKSRLLEATKDDAFKKVRDDPAWKQLFP